MAWFTKRAAEAASASADAARVEAEATVGLVAETLRDRELTWRPTMSVEVTSAMVLPARESGTLYRENDVFFRNIGTGPALRCGYASWSPDTQSAGWTGWCYLHGFDIGAGESKQLQFIGPAAEEAIVWELCGPPHGGDERVRWAVVCSDIFGARYRFTEGRIEKSPHDDEHPPIRATIWR